MRAKTKKFFAPCRNSHIALECSNRRACKEKKANTMGLCCHRLRTRTDESIMFLMTNYYYCNRNDDLGLPSVRRKRKEM